MVDRYCRLRLRRRGRRRRDPRLHLHRQGRRPSCASGSGPSSRGGPRRARSAPRELLGGLGGAWVTTIHGFCNRLLAAHPVAAGIDPRFRVLDAPEAERAAREAFDEALEEFLAAGERRARGDRRRLSTSAGCGGWSSAPTPSCAAAATPSRGCPSRRRADLAAALCGASAEAAPRRGRRAEAEGSANRELVERALELLGDRPPADPRRAARSLRTGEQGARRWPPTGRRSRRRLARGRRGRRGRRAPTATCASSLELFSARASRRLKERRGGHRLRGPADPRRAAARAEPRSATPTASRFSHLLVDEFQDTNRLQLRLIEALRGPATAADRGRRRAAVDLRLPPRRPRRLPRASASAIDASAPARELIELSGNFRSRPEVIGAVNALGEALLGDDYRPLRVGAAPRATPQPGGGTRGRAAADRAATAGTRTGSSWSRRSTPRTPPN